jgi:acetyltransferase-like isoleucine patch superfamily enzyme
MPLSTGSELTQQHRARLVAAGADPEVLASLVLRTFTTSPLDDDWPADGNALYVAEGVEPPPAGLLEQFVLYPVTDTLIVLASQTRNVVSLGVGGDGATIFIGPDCEFTAGDLYCGGGSSIVFNGGVTATRCAIVDARNGGTIVAEPDQLWAANVYLATDDMHRLSDQATGARLNPFGAHIRLGRHVWLGRDVTITGHAEVGDGAVVGSQSMVRGQKIPPNTAVGGVPARVIREGITWSEEDLP